MCLIYIRRMYNHAPLGYPCPFCAIAAGDLDSQGVVYRTRRAAAFIAKHQYPRNLGNTLVIPIEHHENVYDLPLSLTQDIHQLVRAVALAQKALFACDGISTRQHNEPWGSQDVWHYHVHVTPRFENDGFYENMHMARQVMPLQERAELARRLSALVERLV
jgi:histidine triad (HIT) family protein